MAYPLTKPAYALKGHKVFGKAKNNGIIPIYNRVKRYQRSYFEYVYTCYKFDNILTLYAIPFDLDLDKCSPRYKIDGKIDANLILNRLRKKYPLFLDVPMTLVRTKRGGISLLINISPVMYKDCNGLPSKNTEKIIWGFMQAQRNILRLLQKEGMGADECAYGLARMVANYDRPDFVLYNDDRELLNKHRREKTNLLQILWKITKQFNHDSRIYKNTIVGQKLYKHFIELYEQTLENREFITVDESFLLDVGLDLRTVRKIIARDLESLPWLEVVSRKNGQFICRLAGDLNDWELWANDAKNYSIKKKTRKVRSLKTLKMPHLVEDGERNRYLFSAAVLLAHETNNADHLIVTMEKVASKIPNNESSRNCKPRTLNAIVNWAIKTSGQYQSIIRNTPNWLWKIHGSLEAPYRHGGALQRPLLKNSSKNFEYQKLSLPTITYSDINSTRLNYFKIGNNYAVVQSKNNGYYLKLLGFAKTIKDLHAIENDLKNQGYIYSKKIERLQESISNLDFYNSYQSRKHLFLYTKYVILHEPIVWDRIVSS